MKIGIYTDKDVTGSTRIMSEDLAVTLTAIGHEVVVGHDVACLHMTDLAINMIPKDVIALKKASRFVHWNQFMTIFTPHPEVFSKMQIAAQLMSVVDLGPIVCHSKEVYEFLVHSARGLMSPAIQRILGTKMVYVPYGILSDFQDLGTNDALTLIAPFTRCDETYKQFTKHQEVSAFLRAKLGVKTAFYHASDALSHKEKANPDVYDIKPMPSTRAEYRHNMTRYGTFVSTSRAESFGLFYLELLASGVVGVFADYPWVRRLLPDYPFICPINDVAAFTMHTLEHWQENKVRAGAYVLDYVRPQYSLTRFAEDLLLLAI